MTYRLIVTTKGEYLETFTPVPEGAELRSRVTTKQDAEELGKVLAEGGFPIALVAVPFEAELGVVLEIYKNTVCRPVTVFVVLLDQEKNRGL